MLHASYSSCSRVIRPDFAFAVFSRLRGLTSLTLRNTTNHDILEILTMLPVLTVLDAHYLPCAEPVARPASPACRLRHLTIHVDGQSTRTMWTWIPRLVPCTALESLTIRNRRISHSEQLSVKNWAIAPTFLRRVARIHAATLKRLAFDALCMTPEDFRLVCRAFIALETIACHLTKHDMVCPPHTLSPNERFNAITGDRR